MIKSQITNYKSQTNSNTKSPKFQTDAFLLVIVISVLYIVCNLVLGICNFCYAQDSDKSAALSKQIIGAKSNAELYAPFEELKDSYFKDNKYTEFVESLRALSQQKKALEPFTDYYIALSRYQQLKYLEETQGWDEYFSQGNTYRDELTKAAQNAIDATTINEPLNPYARLILWQFHKDQQDAFAEQALTDLMNSVMEYSKVSADTKPIKEAADKLLSYGEKGKSKELYRIYAEKLAASDIKDDSLAAIASGFYKEGNLDLAESIYNIYLDRITASTPREKLLPVLTDIAREFSYKDQGPSDPVYAEKIFKKIEELAGKKVFDQELMYLRAFNLEKAKEYQKAKDAYIDFLLAFPAATHSDEAVFKVGIINTYILKDKKEGRNYFKELISKTGTLRPWGISALYQLGLLSQWEDDLTAANDYYNRLIKEAAGKYPQMLARASERLKEIEEGKPMEYGLKTFLDVSLKEEYSALDMSKIDLRTRPYQANKEQAVNISSAVYAAPTGCMEVQLQYLWSGDLGSKKPSNDQSAFATVYTDTGTQVINLVVVSPSGIIDRSLDLVDTY
jgi:TolA-binding protein